MQCYPWAFGPRATLHNFGAKVFSVDLSTSQYLYNVLLFTWLLTVCVCVGEWSRRPRYNSVFVYERQVTFSLVLRQWRSRVGHWLSLQSHSTAEQSTTTTMRPRRQKLFRQSVVAMAIMLQWTHITTVHCAWQWCRLSTQSTLSLSNWLITSEVGLTMLMCTLTALEHCLVLTFTTYCSRLCIEL